MVGGAERNGRQDYFDEGTAPRQFGKIRYVRTAVYVQYTSVLLQQMRGKERIYHHLLADRGRGSRNALRLLSLRFTWVTSSFFYRRHLWVFSGCTGFLLSLLCFVIY